MPDRIVRAGILSSDPVNRLSWAGEVFYRRLHSVVDDFGRYDGRPTMLRAHLYPLKIDRVSDADVGKWLAECAAAGLVSVYQVSGQPYVEVLKFGQRVRSETSKWPANPGIGGHPLTNDGGCQQMTALCVDVCVDEVVVGSGPEPALPAPVPAITLPLVDKSEFPITEAQVLEFRELYPAVDVMAQLREMRGWCIGNPTKKKTKAGILRFVTSWLAKEQDRGGSPPAAGYTPPGAVRNPVGASPKKTETPESRLEDARLLAARQVDLKEWTVEQARDYVAKAKAAL